MEDKYELLIGRDNPGRVAHSHKTGGNIFENHRIRADPAAIANDDFADYLGPDPDHDVISYPGGFSRATDIPYCDVMIHGAIVANPYRWMQNNASEMMNPESFSYSTCSRNGNTSGNFDKAFTEETERMPGDSTFIEPAKESVYQNRLEPLGQKTA